LAGVALSGMILVSSSGMSVTITQAALRGTGMCLRVHR
jgi:hypothetical protein